MIFESITIPIWPNIPIALITGWVIGDILTLAGTRALYEWIKE